MSGGEGDPQFKDAQANHVHFNNVLVIGMGLMGGSFAAALKHHKRVNRVIGYDQFPVHAEKAVELGITDEAARSVEAASVAADLIMIAVPVMETVATLQAIKKGLGDRPLPLVTDVGSVKTAVIEAASQVFGYLPPSLVPGHPIAGSEKHGIEAARGSLYADHRVILTPTEETDKDALEKVRNLWQALGSQVVIMEARHHDEVLAQTSHLPHLLAYALVDTLCNQPDGREIFRYAAGGFRDFSRIAASDPTMWRDIFSANRQAVLGILDKFLVDLQDIRGLIDRGEMQTLSEKLARAKEARDYFSSLGNKEE